MNINQLLDAISLPKRYFSESFVIGVKFKDEIERYFELLDECEETDLNPDDSIKFQQNLMESKTVASDIAQKIIAIFKSYEDSNYKDTQELFDAIMESLKPIFFISFMNGRIDMQVKEKHISTCLRLFGSSNGEHFFRIRAVDERNQAIESNPDELFHIPMAKRAYSSNERFSLAGFPCLYLSTMLPLAWQECNYPKKYYYSEYQYLWDVDQNGKINVDKEVKLLALYSPIELKTWGYTVKYNHFEIWNEVVGRYLKMYPLILACSFINQSGNTPYKQEYIIPQMLMQWVKRNSDVVKGIEYFSCVDMAFDNSKWCANNIVLPAFAPYENGVSQLLKEKFTWTKPKFYEIPIISKSKTEADRKFLYEFMEEINQIFHVYHMPDVFVHSLVNMEETASCLLNLMANDRINDMRELLRILELLITSVEYITKLELLTDIENKIAETREGTLSGDAAVSAGRAFRKIYENFIGEDNSVKSIAKKHKDLLWNFYEAQPEWAVLYKSADEIDGFKELLQSNHRIFHLYKSDEGQGTFDLLKSAAQSDSVPMDAFWIQKGKSENWMREHMAEIKTPILIELNNVSIYSNDNVKPQRIVSIGFDKNMLNNLLQNS